MNTKRTIKKKKGLKLDLNPLSLFPQSFFCTYFVGWPPVPSIPRTPQPAAVQVQVSGPRRILHPLNFSVGLPCPGIYLAALSPRSLQPGVLGHAKLPSTECCEAGVSTGSTPGEPNRPPVTGLEDGSSKIIYIPYTSFSPYSPRWPPQLVVTPHPSSPYTTHP